MAISAIIIFMLGLGVRDCKPSYVLDPLAEELVEPV